MDFNFRVALQAARSAWVDHIDFTPPSNAAALPFVKALGEASQKEKGVARMFAALMSSECDLHQVVPVMPA
jgi:hypothetical protein